MPDEIVTQNADATPEKGQDSPKETESNSKPVKTYTEAEHKKAIEDAIAQYGDKIKREKLDPITRERDEYKTKAESAVNETTKKLEKTEKRIAELEADLETAIGDNADLADIQKIKRKLRDAEEQLEKDYTDKAKALEDKEKELNLKHEQFDALVTEAQAARFEVDVFEISEEYVDDTGKQVPSERLKALCEKAGKRTRDEIVELAEVLWTKKVEKKPEAEPIETDSGVGSGGGGKLTIAQVRKMTPEERMKRRAEIAKLPLSL